ncbi:MAG: hypothetical protein WC814_03170 [Candidatus Paceibacterota bacterium]|jgi:Tfp pilus assembly protein PilN
MNNEPINLLPQERQRTLAREYLLRLGTVAAFMITALTFVAGLLLLPTYVFLSQSAIAKEAHLANIEFTLSSENEAALSAHLAALSSDAELLIALGRSSSASATIRDALGVSHPGIALSGFAYTPAGKVPGTLAVSGVAATRDALRTYQLALQKAPFVASAELPVSAYAKDTHIVFTIMLTLAL